MISDLNENASTCIYLLYLVIIEARCVLGLLVCIERVSHPDLLPVVGRGGPGQGQQQHVEGVNCLRPKSVGHPAVVMVSKLAMKLYIFLP